MKIYELDGMMYREPLPKGFDFENAVEILSPILEDGTIISSHPKSKYLIELFSCKYNIFFFDTFYTINKGVTIIYVICFII